MRAPAGREGRVHRGIGAFVVASLLGLALAAPASPRFDDDEPVALPRADTVEGYVARLLVNEVPFPGERGWVSEADSKAAMEAILSVLDARLRHIPAGYRQEHIAAQKCDTVIEVITAGGEKGQCDGFYLDANKKFVAVPRVEERIDYLTTHANKGAPGKFASLLRHASGLATAYVQKKGAEAAPFATLERVGDEPVTGRAYSWMTDHESHHPGGNFVRITDAQGGSLGGNRFFTLRKSP
jgi:hypothetical protein